MAATVDSTPEKTRDSSAAAVGEDAREAALASRPKVNGNSVNMDEPAESNRALTGKQEHCKSSNRGGED